MTFQRDILEFLSLLHRHQVKYLIVGGEAVIYYGHTRLTGDIDLFYGRIGENVERLYAALLDFWGNDVPGVGDAAELAQEGLIVQFGVPPNRIDLINRITGVQFDLAWPRRTTVAVGEPADEVPIHYLGMDDLIKNKRAAGRPKDLEDLRFLERRRTQDS